MHIIKTEVAPIHIVSTRDDARQLWAWLRARQDQILALDLETNGVQDTFSRDFRQRLTQMSDGRESWVIQSERPGMLDVSRICIHAHRYWIAHYSENDIRFAECAAPGSIRLDQLEPHVADMQPIVAWYEPRTVTSADKPGIDVRIRLDRGLKSCVKRWLPEGHILNRTESELHRRFLEISIEAGPYDEYTQTVRRHKDLIDKYGIEANGAGVSVRKAFEALSVESQRKTLKGADSWDEKALSLLAAESGEEARLAQAIIALRKLNSASPLTAKARRSWGFAHIPDDDPAYLTYAGLDPLMTVRLLHKMKPELKRRGQWPEVLKDLRRQWQIDLMTFRGMLIDHQYARQLSEDITNTITRRQDYLDRHKINSSGMGGGIGRAFTALGMTTPKTTGNGADSWDKHVLEDIASGKVADAPSEAIRLANAITKVRQNTKFHSAYVQPMLNCQDSDGRIHCSMREIGCISSRNSAERPPMQQMPKRASKTIRAAFCAPHGWVFVSADLKQGEPRVMAGISGDKNLRTDILEGDINSALATLAFGAAFNPDPAVCKDPSTRSFIMRDRSKIAFLSRSYGAQNAKLAETLLVSPDRMRDIQNNWNRRYHTLAAYERRISWQKSVVLDNGWVLPLWDRYRIDDATGEPVLKTPPKPSRLALNGATQGNQAVLLKEARDRVYARGWGWAVVMLVHDEIVGCVPLAQAEEFRQVLIDCMTTTFHGVPIECDATIDGPTWMPQKPFEPDVFDAGLVEMSDA
jgi:DNA polymerase I